MIRLSVRLAVASLFVFAAACDGCGDSIAEGRRALIDIPDSPVVFDRISLGDSQEKWATISNVGDGPLTIDGWRWEGDGSEFTVTGIDGLELEPGQNATIQIVYAPGNAGVDAATIVLDSNAANPGDARIELITPGLSSQIQATPNPLFVDADRLNADIDSVVQLFNVGSRPFTIDSLRMETGLGHFSVVEPPTLPVDVPADGSVSLTVRYSPATGGNHTDRILVGCDADNCDNGFYLVELQGTALTPYLVLSPPEVGFGTIEIGETVTADITARNEGQAVAVIDSTTLAVNPLDGDDEIQIVRVDGVDYDGTGAFELEPEEETLITVSYTPADNENDTESLVVRSNDPELPIQQVRLSGRAAAPRLEVFPAVVEFGSVAVGFGPIEREISIRNAGTAPLTLDPLIFRDGQGAFTMVNGDRMPSELAADETFTLRVRYDPPTEEEVADDAYFGSVFVLPTNDPSVAEVIVQLEGFRADAPVCEIRVLPATLNFGTVPRGSRVEQTGRFRNVGSGPCEILTAGLESSLIGFIFSNYYEFVGMTPPAPVTLAPGDEVSVTAAYFPRTITPLGETFGDAGSIALDVRDPFAGRVECGTVPGPFTGSTRLCGMNLQARSAIAQIEVIPGNIDFGLVTLGCNSQAQSARIYNTGTADVQVTGVRLEGCGAEVTLTGTPTLPRTLSRGESIEVSVTYRPADPGEDRCTMVVEGTTEGGGAVVVPIVGEGVTFSRTIDTFEQVSGREVDVLFVIDNSGSMGEEQRNLGRNFSSFISSATGWGTDFQIGVVTTQIEGNVSDPSGGGSRQPGELLGSPRIITPSTPSFASAFSRNAAVGTSDPGTAESGLESARLALTDPVITDLDAPCDADCVDPYACVPGADGGPSRCGGYNRTFLRESASLEIIFVSDEEDQSRASEDFFVDFFATLKGVYNDALFNASAIVGPRGGCSSSDGDAVAGERYIAVAEATGGAVGSICDAEFARSLEEIGDRAFGLRRQFGLSRAADPSTVQVYGLTSCSGGSRTAYSGSWTYDRATNAILFAEGDEPDADTCFEVEYEAACY